MSENVAEKWSITLTDQIRAESKRLALAVLSCNETCSHGFSLPELSTLATVILADDAELIRLTARVAELEAENGHLTAVAVGAEARAEKAHVDMIEWRKAAQTFTPGGSEFMTPQAVVEFVRERRNHHHETMVGKVKAEKRAIAAESKVAELEASLVEARAELEDLRPIKAHFDDCVAEQVEEAKSDADDFEKDLWVKVRSILTKIPGFDFDDNSEGVSAGDAYEYLNQHMLDLKSRAESAERERDEARRVLGDALAGMLDAFGGYMLPEVDAGITAMQSIGVDRWSANAQMKTSALAAQEGGNG